ncbi:MAG: Uma2 family endonuclease [Cyanobacteria bacterium J06641_5]
MKIQSGPSPVALPRRDRVLLHGLSWQQFETVLTTLGAASGARIAYDLGTLEIMTPLPEHEYYKDAIGDAIKDIAEILEQDYECLGSATWRREAQKVGVEPDNCFYLQNESRIRGKLQYDLATDPPPDLVLEIDLTSKSLDRFPIYARLGVPEIWCYDAGKLQVFVLGGDLYQPASQSLAFPQVPVSEILTLIERHRHQGRRILRQKVRAWAQQFKGV